jgi:hypothetical protein
MVVLLPCLVVGQRPELPEQGEVVADGQVLGDQARVVKGQDVDLAHGGGPVRCGYAVKGPVVGAGHDPDSSAQNAWARALLPGKAAVLLIGR